RIGRITLDGVIDEFDIPSPNSGPLGIVTGCDGNLWFTEGNDPGRIGRITPGGVITEFTAGLSENSFPVGIAAGPGRQGGVPGAQGPGRAGKNGAGWRTQPAPG